MASKVYTASEMRHRADKEQHSYHDNITAAMLRQAADMMEREKKYEYAVEYEDLYHGGWSVYKNGLTLDEAQKLSTESWSRIVRREVGDWEEVKNEK